MSARGKVCLVTGATRGIGKGIALRLGQAATTLYITGRGSDQLKKCAEEARARGAKEVIPLQVDHSKDEEVRKLFQTIETQQDGKLDLLVNNAYSGGGFLFDNLNKPFWEVDPSEGWDVANNVGLRNNFICASLASRMMVKQHSGLIVNVSSGGGIRYFLSVPYGIGKCAMDRMAADCAIELKRHNVAMVSLWPGVVKTEAASENASMKDALKGAETPEFVGKAVVGLLEDPTIMRKTGRIVLTSDLSRWYKFTEDDGTSPVNKFSLKEVLAMLGNTWVAALVPSFLRVPKVAVHLSSYKF